MEQTRYHKNIVDYYRDSENAYRDSWNLDKSLAIHYGYWDEKVKSFPQSLLRMNEVMAEAAAIRTSDRVLDAGCGVGGSSFFLAEVLGCKVTGITLSERQAQQAAIHAKKKRIDDLVDFKKMDYLATDYPDGNFDVIWACESMCYAEDKKEFMREAFRLLKPGGRLVVADGFVSEKGDNEHPVIRKWLDGWAVNFLESPAGFTSLAVTVGFRIQESRDITKYVARSSRRLLKYYFLAKCYLGWKTITFSNKATLIQRKNIKACWYQHRGLKLKLWQYGLVVCIKP